MKRSRVTALFNVFLSLTLVVSLAPSFAWAENTSGGGSALTTTSSWQDSSEPDPQDSGQQGAAPAKGPRKAPAAMDPVAEVDGVQYDTLKKAILAAPAAGTVTVLRDFTEYVTNDSDGKEVTIDLDGHTWTATDGMSFNMTGKAVLYTTKKVTIKNGTITGGDTAEMMSGRAFGAVTANSATATVTLDNVKITGNKGCAVWSYQGQLTIQNNSEISNNEGVSSAGDEAYGIVGSGRGIVEIKNSTITNNTGGFAPIGSIGTATTSQPARYSLTDTSVSNNAGSKAGAIYYTGRSVGATLSNSTISNNIGGKAGAIYFSSTSNTQALTLNSGALITKNQGTESESTGGIYLASGKAAVNSSAVYKNKGSDFLLGNMSAVLPAANTMMVNGSALEGYYYEHGKEGDTDYQKFDVGTTVPAGNYSPALSLVVTNGVVPEGVDDNGPWEYGDYRFVSLEKAVAAYNGDGGSEGEIKLLKDVEENATIATLGTTAKAAVIDLGTYTMKAADASKEVISVTGASNITVKGGTICNGLHGIRVAGNSTIVLDSVTVKDNASMGVVSYVGTSALNVSNCTFTNNGGKTNNDNAISWNGVLSVKNTQFTGNARGISSNMASTPLVFEGLTFSQNKGRALFVSLNRTDSATVSNCTFTENTLSSGNLVEISGSSKTVTIEDCTIENNSGAAKTVNLGAGLVATLKGCTISGNSAVDTNSAVGGVSASGAKVTLADTVIKNNKAENTGVSNITIARIATGGVYTPSSSGTLTMSGSTAIYGNTATAANTTEVANDIYWDGATLNVAAAKDMVDGSFDFTDYVWDDLKGNPITTQLSGTTSSPKLLTAKPADEVAYVAKIGEVGYKTLEEAFAAVKDGETIRVVIKETNPQATNLSASAITVNKDVTLDVNGVTVAGLGSTLFTVADSGKLTIKDSVADANSEIQRYNFADAVINQVGGIEGTIATTGSGKLTLASSMDTRNLTVKHNGAALVLDKPINPLKVSLGVDKFITFSDSWNAFAGTATAYSSPRITVTLDSAVLAALNDDNMDEPDVLIATGADSFIREYIKVEGITADHVRKVYIDSESPKKLVLRQYPLVGVYVDGVAGSDTDGNGSVGNPVKTFAKAKELLAQQANAEGIIVMNTLVVDEDASWDLLEDGIGGRNKLIRFEEFSGNLVRVAPEATLSLSNIVFDGQGSEGVVAGKGYTPGDGSLIYVSPEGGLVLDSGAVLQNNYVQNRNGDTSCGGGVYSAGALTITDGRVSGNRAVQGAGIYQVGKVQGAETDYTGTLTMTGGSVDQNQAVYPSERIVIDPDTGQPHYSLMPAGGGIMLAFGAQMDFTGGSVTNNASNHIGGGISLGTTGNAYTTCLTASGITMLNMAGNALIDGNTADMEGGGIYVQINAVADVRAGTISNNTARGLTPYFNPHTGQLAVSVSHGGGGIYVNGTSKAYYAAKISSSRTVPYTPGILKLYNAEISDNTAQAGGSAFAFCATGDAAIFELASSVIYNNHNANNIDICMTGVDHLSGLQFEQQLDDITYYVSEYAMGGEAYKWQIVDTDGDGASTNAKKSDIQGNNKRLALTTSLANVADSLGKVKVRIVGNTSGMYGGGIGSNGTVINGSQAPVIDIKATKVWADNEQKVVQQPTSLKFKLERKKSIEGDEAYKEIDSAVVEAKDGKIEVVFEEQLLYADFVAPDSPENIEWVYRIVEDTDFRPTVSGSSVWAGPDNNGKAVADLYSVKTETKADTSRLASETYKVADTITVKNFEVTNTPKIGNLEVSKTLSGEGADSTKEFTFTVTLDASAYGANAKITGTYGDLEFKDNVATFTLKGGETKTATGLPISVKYTVAEADYTADNYAATSTGDAGTIEEGKTAKAAFTNTYNPPENPPEPEYTPSTPVDVVLVKHLHDALIHAEEFSFGLYDENGTLLDTVHTTLGTHTNPAEDEYSSYVEIAFKDLVFKEPVDRDYTIREHMDGTTQVVEGDEWNKQGFEPGYYKGGVKYDDKEYRVHISVSDEDADGVLEAQVTYPDSATGIENAELFNEYSETYIVIDEFDSHPNDGLHTPDPEPKEDDSSTDDKGKKDDDTKKDTPTKDTPADTPKTTPTAKTGTLTADGNPTVLLMLVAVIAAGTAGFAFRRRKRE